MNKPAFTTDLGIDISDCVLDEAKELVSGDRNADYNHPILDFSRTAQMWSAMKGVKFEARDVALFMIAVKLSRECNKPKRDNRVDVAGYIYTLDLIERVEDEVHSTQNEMGNTGTYSENDNHSTSSAKE